MAFSMNTEKSRKKAALGTREVEILNKMWEQNWKMEMPTQ